MSTTFSEDCVAVLNVAMPAAERRAQGEGRVLQASERAEVARLVRESLNGNHESLTALKVWTGAPASSPAKPAAPAVNEATDLGRALLAGRHRSPFFAETAPRTAAQIAEAAGIDGATPGISDEIGRMPLINGDEKFRELTQSWAKTVSFGGQRLDS
jgi:hypothetical protein